MSRVPVPSPAPVAPLSRADLVRCAACIYFDGGPRAPIGKCLRYPPVGGGLNQPGGYPVTNATGTCGEGRAEVTS